MPTDALSETRRAITVAQLGGAAMESPLSPHDETGSVAAKLAAAYRDMASFLRQHTLQTPEEFFAAADRQLNVATECQRLMAGPPDQMSWFDLARLFEHDPQAGHVVWEDVKRRARQELVSGHRAAEILEQSGEPWQRAQFLIEADLVDCMVALPGQLFYSTQIPVCLWFLARDKRNGRFRDRRGETLFIDARKLGTMVDRVHRELTDEDIARIAGTYHAWRGDPDAGEYADIPGFCKAATLDDIRKHGHVLTPGRYVGAEAAEDDGEPFEEKMKRLTATLRQQQAEAAKLDAAIAANLRELGYGG